MEYLISLGRDLNVIDVDNNSALYYACVSGCFDIVKELLKHGANINIGRNILIALARSSYGFDYSMMKLLIEHGADVHKTNFGGDSILNIVIGQSKMDIAEMLLEKGVKDLPNKFSKQTELMNCSSVGKWRFVELLLKYGSDVNVRNNKGETALIISSQ